MLLPVMYSASAVSHNMCMKMPFSGNPNGAAPKLYYNSR
jgi:hypothetical protein